MLLPDPAAASENLRALLDLRSYLTLTPDINEVEHSQRIDRFFSAFQMALDTAANGRA